MHNIVLTDEDIQFINEAASILMPFYKAQQFMAKINGQVEKGRQDKAKQERERIDAQIASAVKDALAYKNDGVAGE